MTNEMADILLEIREDFIKKKKVPLHIIVSEEEVIVARPKKGFTIADMDRTLGLLVESTSDAFIAEDPHSSWEHLIYEASKHTIYRFNIKDGGGYVELSMIRPNEKK